MPGTPPTPSAKRRSWRSAVERDIPFQQFVNRSDLACGSTIGPISAAAAGIRTLDVGVAQLSMHSIREVCGADDPVWFRAGLEGFLQSS